MQIEVAIVIDGQNVKASSDLEGLLENLVASYIRQKFIMGKSNKLPKMPKDPNAPKREVRPHWTEEQKQSIGIKTMTLHNQGYTMSKIAKTLSEEFGRSPSGVTSIIIKLRKMGVVDIPIDESMAHNRKIHE